MKDFGKARFTAIVSDLHLCEAEPVHPKFRLWKKYKTREFFFDSSFAEFLRHTTEMSGGEEVELILNGDIFDFDSVMALPPEPLWRLSWLEKRRGLAAEEEKSVFKIETILDAHPEWVEALRWFLLCGHRVVFVIGNHDLELHWPAVQAEIVSRLDLTEPYRENIRFCEFFYISNGDTFIEHGNQQDPYCLCIDPINPFVLQYNKVEIRLPFGNLAARYLVNGMGFFNPHVESAYIMTVQEYFRFFFRYMARAQPFLIWTWLWGATVTLIKSFSDALLPTIRDPLSAEDRIEQVALKGNGTSRMVRELRELFARPAVFRPLIVARELWLDRALLLLFGLLGLLQVILLIKQIYDISVFWIFIPILLMVPFFLFYSRSIRSNVEQYKEPQPDVLAMVGAITKVRRVIYGHTHVIRHEVFGSVEHLNPGSWSPAFLDVECTKPIGQKAFVWLNPAADGTREARVYHFTESGSANQIRKTAAKPPQQLPR